MSRFVFELQGVIDAETESEANALAERIAAEAGSKFRFGAADKFPPNAVLAILDVESVAPKVIRTIPA